MSVRTVVLVGLLVLGAGVAGYLLGTRTPEAGPARRPAVEPPRAQTPERRVEPAPEPAPEPRPAPEADGRREEDPNARERRLRAALEDYLDALDIPTGVRREAEALGVSERALRLTYAAEWWLHAARQTPGPTEKEGVRAALAALTAEGEAGFLAVLALLRGHGHGTYYEPMLRATWRPGMETRLFEAIDVARARGGAVHRAYEALGAVDTDDVRRYLRAALERQQEHAANFAGAAAALGRLGDAEGVPLVAAALDKPAWIGLRPTLLTALGGMGGDAAKEVLLAYLASPRANVESFAVRALARIDPALARAEAEALLAGERGREVSATERQRLRAFLAEAE